VGFVQTLGSAVKGSSSLTTSPDPHREHHGRQPGHRVRRGRGVGDGADVDGDRQQGQHLDAARHRQRTGGFHTAQFSSVLTTALVSGDTITVTQGGTATANGFIQASSTAARRRRSRRRPGAREQRGDRDRHLGHPGRRLVLHRHPAHGQRRYPGLHRVTDGAVERPRDRADRLDEPPLVRQCGTRRRRQARRSVSRRPCRVRLVRRDAHRRSPPRAPTSPPARSPCPALRPRPAQPPPRVREPHRVDERPDRDARHRRRPDDPVQAHRQRHRVGDPPLGRCAHRGGFRVRARTSGATSLPPRRLHERRR
jgi:hypothetical protein